MMRAIGLAALGAALTMGLAPADAQLRPAPSRPVQPKAGPFWPLQRLPPMIQPAAPGGARRLTCLINPSANHVYMAPDWSDPSQYGMQVKGPQQAAETWTWLPSRLAVFMQFYRGTSPAAGLKPGECAFDDRPVGAGEPEQVVFPRQRDAWSYAWVGDRPVLVPMASQVEDLLTQGRRVTFNVRLTPYPAANGEPIWYADDPPETP